MFLLATFVLAYIIFAEKDFLFLQEALIATGYLGSFLLGIFFVYGFTAGPATALLLLTSGEQNIIIAGLVAGCGALLGDLVIFRFIRHYFTDEIESLGKEKIINSIGRFLPKIVKKYLTLTSAVIIIASPLPDEIGVTLLASSPIISTKYFSILSYILNTLGIFTILFASTYLSK